MRNVHIKRGLVSAVAGSLIMFSCSSHAQEGPKGQIEILLDNNGINYGLTSLYPMPSIKESGVSIGERERGGLEFTRTMSAGGTQFVFGHNFNFQVSVTTEVDITGFNVVDSYYSVTAGDYRDDFSDCSGGVCTSRSGNGAILQEGTSNWIYYAQDGAVVTFENRPTPTDDFNAGYGVPIAVGTLLERPNGEKITLTYYENGGCGGGCPNRRRLSSVNSNFGYQIKIEYAANTRVINSSGKNNTQEWHRVISVSGINSGVYYCDPSAIFCNDPVNLWPRATYTQSIGTIINQGGVNYAALIDGSLDSGGLRREYSFSATEWPDGWRRSGFGLFKKGNPASLVASFGNALIETVDGATTYEVPDVGDIWDVGRYALKFVDRIDPRDGERSVVVSKYSGKPLSITDENGKTTTLRYDVNDRLIYVISPEGTMSGDPMSEYGDHDGSYTTPRSGPISTPTPLTGYMQNFYDGRGNVIQVKRVSKSGAQTINTYADFPVNCPQANRKICNKPSSTRDANGNQTDYIYDAAHGGVLTEMKPGVTIGTPGSTVTARPLVVTTWAQRSAWVKNASGNLVQSPDPVWLVSTVTECQTAAGSNTPSCSATAPQTVTTYEYGASGTRESLLLKGMAVSSGGDTLRTCYGYDVFGRRISETKPNANLLVCP